MNEIIQHSQKEILRNFQSFLGKKNWFISDRK